MRRDDEIRYDRLAGRAVERPRRAERDENEEDEADVVGTSYREQQERGRAESLADEADAHDRAAREAIRHRAGDEHEHQRRQELRQADETEVEGIAGQVVDLPSDRHGLDLDREARRQMRDPELGEAGIAERHPARGTWTFPRLFTPNPHVNLPFAPARRDHVKPTADRRIGEASRITPLAAPTNAAFRIPG